MAWVGAVAGALGGVQQGATAAEGAKSSATAYGINASINDDNALRARENAQSDILSLQKTAYKTIGAQRAGYAAAGVTGGSALDVMADSMSEAILDQQRRKYQGELEWLDQKNQEMINQLNAEAVRSGGQAAGAAAVLSGVGTAATRMNFGSSSSRPSTNPDAGYSNLA